MQTVLVNLVMGNSSTRDIGLRYVRNLFSQSGYKFLAGSKSSESSENSENSMTDILLKFCQVVQINLRRVTACREAKLASAGPAFPPVELSHEAIEAT